MRLNIINFCFAVALLAVGGSATPCFGEDIGEQRSQELASSLVGTPAPKLDVSLLNGEKVSLGALAGEKPVYLKFWAA